MGSALVSVLAASALFAQIETSRPDVGPLEPRFRVELESRDDGTYRTGFYLGGPLRVGHWIVFSINKFRGGFGASMGPSAADAKQTDKAASDASAELNSAFWAGLVAYDLDSRRAIQLIPPRPGDDPSRVSWVTHHYRMGPDRCAVVMTQLQRKGAQTERLLGEFLWEWDLDRNTLRPVGDWNDARLLQLVLDPGLVETAVRSTAANGGQTIEIRDRQTGQSTRIVTNEPRLLESVGFEDDLALSSSPVIIPQADRRSFIVSERGDPPAGEEEPEVRFSCVDPRGPNGRRWILRQSDLRKATGQKSGCIYPVKGLSREATAFAIGLKNYVSPDKLVLVDKQTGRITRTVRLTDVGVAEFHTPPTLSPDGVFAACIVDGPHTGRLRQLVVLNASTGRLSWRTDVDGRLRSVGELFEFDDRGRILASTAEGLVRITGGKSPTFEQLFSLDPTATQQDQKITSAGLKELCDVNSLRMLVLKRMVVSDAMLDELAGCKHLRDLVLDVPSDADGGLKEIGRLANLTSLVLTDNHITPAYYGQLGRLGNLRHLVLQPGGSIPQVGWDQLGNLTELVSLSIDGVFDDNFKTSTFRKLENLASLNLGYLPFKEHDVDALAGLSSLEQLQFDVNVTGRNLSKLKKLPKLVDLKLSLNRNEDFDAIVAELGTFPHLTRLRIADNNTLSREVLKQLGGLRTLTELDLHSFGVDFSSGSLEGLAECKNLTRLHLTDYTVKADDLREILKLSKLTHLDLSGTSVAAVDLGALTELRKLEELDLYSPEGAFDKLTDARLAGLRGLTNLKSLRISGNPISDAGLQQLSSLKHLERLQMAHAPITDRGLKSLQTLKDLAELDLYDTEITDVGLSELRGLRKLKSLELGGTQITDTGMKQLTSLGALRRLNLEATSITDAGLKDVAAIESLEELDLSATAVSDAGLKQLKRLTNLRSLSLRRTAVTDAGLRELKALPNLSTLTLGR